MKFDLAEQLAILKAVDEVIRTDDRVYEEEATFLSELAGVLQFDLEMIRDARKLTSAEAITTLKAMAYSKKRTLAVLLHEAAGSDGRVSDDELERIQDLVNEIDID